MRSFLTCKGVPGKVALILIMVEHEQNGRVSERVPGFVRTRERSLNE